MASTSFCEPSTVTVDSAASTVATSTSPTGSLMSRRTGPGVTKRCSVMAGTEASGLLSGPAVAGEAMATATGRGARLERADERLHEPGVDGHAAGGGGRLEARLQALGQAQRDPGAEAPSAASTGGDSASLT